MKPQVVLDTEIYQNYFLLAFKDISTGKSKSFEIYDGSDPFPADEVMRIMEGCETVSFNGLKFDLPLITLACKGGEARRSNGLGGVWSDEPQVCEGGEAYSGALKAVGIDLGITTFATLSTGEKIDNPKHFKQAERRLAIRQRKLAKKEKGSKNREKAKAVVARTHAQVANKRKGFLHQTTTDIANRFDVAVIENLNVEGMLKNRHLSKAISGASFSEFRRQLEYKMKDRVFVADRWFPSSKTCSDCGHKVKSLPLSVREWTCPECGSVHDRDVNAAKNLLKEFDKYQLTGDSK